MKVLSGHYSPETAYVVEDYPYGFRLRCKIRYWLEVNSKGTRFWSQTTNPKRGDVWNKPKASTYSLMGAMYLDEENHVQWCGLSPYDASKCKDFLETYSVGLTEGERTFCAKLAEGYASLQARKAQQELGNSIAMAQHNSSQRSER